MIKITKCPAPTPFLTISIIDINKSNTKAVFLLFKIKHFDLINS
jgi:hypothetical protein